MSIYGEPPPQTKLLLSVFTREYVGHDGALGKLVDLPATESYGTYPAWCTAKGDGRSSLRDVLETVENLIAASADVVRERDLQGRSPLHLACSVQSPGQIDVIRTICSARPANINILDTKHRTPLHHALSPYNIEYHSKYGEGERLMDLLRALILMGADPSACDVKGVTPLHLALDFHCAGYAGKLLNLPAILGVLKRSGANMKAPAFTYSLRFGSYNQIRSSLSPIHLACKMDGPQSIQAIKYFLSPETLNCVDSLGRTPLHTAIMTVCRSPRKIAFVRDAIFPSDSDFVKEKVDLLLGCGADVNVDDVDGMTPVLTAIELFNYEHSVDIIRTLLCNGAIAVKRDREKRTTPLHLACEYFDRSLPELVPYFIKAGGRLNVPDCKLYTPFHCALKKRACSLATLTYLVDAGANASAVDAENNNSIHIVCNHRQPNLKEIVAFLIDRGCSIDHANSHGNTPLLHLLQSDYDVESVKALLELGAGCKVTNSESISPLHLVCRSLVPSQGNAEIVDLMIKAGADVNARDRSKSTPLFYAVKDEPTVDKDVVLLLLLAGANPNFSNDQSMTPLHVVCSYGNHELASMLLAFGAKVNKVNAEGNTPLHEAVQAKSGDPRRTCQVLVSAGANVSAQNFSSRTPFLMMTYMNDSFRFLVGHVVLLIYDQKYKLNRCELNHLEHTRIVAKHHAECFSCVQAMKSHRLGNSNVTLWSFLLAPPVEARRYARNPTVLKDLYSIADSGMKYRPYAQTIKDKAMDCERFHRVFKLALVCLTQIFPDSNLPLIVSERIISYLNEYEMQALLMAVFGRTC